MMQYRTAKIGRNDPCPCASGLKYKKCCYECNSLGSEASRFQKIQGDLKKKIEKGGNEVIFLEPNSQSVKMSEVLLEFADDMLRHAETNTEKKKAIDLASLAWNLAILKEKDKEKYETTLNLFLEQMGINDPEDIFLIQPLIDALVDKKLDEYSDIDRLIVHYQIDFVRGELMLNVASTIVHEEMLDSVGKS